MDVPRRELAQRCLTAAHDGSMDFPAILEALAEAGFEGYAVDFRRHEATYYLPDGDSVTLGFPSLDPGVAAEFRSIAIEQAVARSQTRETGYSYPRLCVDVTAAGCAGYIVSLLGKRVLYYGRTAETHVEHFPRE